MCTHINVHTQRENNLRRDKERGHKRCKWRVKDGERERERRRDRKKELSERGLIFLWPYTCKLKQFLPSKGQVPLSSSPVPTV